MNAVDIIQTREILDKSLGETFEVIADSNDFAKVYGPGVKHHFNKGDLVILKEYNFIEKINTFSVLLANIRGNTQWVPISFINIDLETDDNI